MRKLVILEKIVLLFPDWIQILVYKIFYLLFSKKKYSKKIIISSKTTTNSKTNLVIADNMKAIGDFFILLQTMLNIEKNNTDQQYVFAINGIYQDFVNQMGFKKIKFIFLKQDFGRHYDRKHITNEKIIEKSLNIATQIKECSPIWNNVFVLTKTLDLLHYSCLTQINYNKCYTLKSYKNKKRIRIVYQNLPIPSLKLWTYFFNFRKLFKINYWNQNSDEYYYFGHMCFDMIKSFDKNLNKVKFKFYSYPCDKKTNKISLTLQGSNYIKNMNLNFITEYINKINYENIDYVYLNKNTLKLNDINNKNFFNLSGNTKNLEDFIKQIKESFLTITVDTSSYHIANFYGIPTIVLINKKEKFLKKHINFWIDFNSELNQIIVLNKNFFKTKKNKWEKLNMEFEELIKTSKEIIEKYKN